MAQLLELFAGDLGCPLSPQPGCKQRAAGGGIDLAECLAIQPIRTGQALQGEFAQSVLGGSQLSHALAQARNAVFTAGMQLVQHGHHLMADLVAFKGVIVIAGIQPNW